MADCIDSEPASQHLPPNKMNFQQNWAASVMDNAFGVKSFQIVYHRAYHNKMILIFSKRSRKLECVSFKMGYRGLLVCTHSAWDPFRRPRGLDFRVCDFPDFLALKTNYLYLFTAARAAARAPRAACVAAQLQHA